MLRIANPLFVGPAGDYHPAMPNYRRAVQPGGTFFFTLVTAERRPFLIEELARDCLRRAIERTRGKYPFDIDAFVLLPDHLHAQLTLPTGDSDYSTRWALIKRRFTRSYLERGGTAGLPSRPTMKRASRGEVELWQSRFHEHTIRDNDDLIKHVDYIHYNPVKHGYATCPHAWPYSSFHRYVREGKYDITWSCTCSGRTVTPPDFKWATDREME